MPNLNDIADQIAACTKCGLCRHRTKPVPGSGNAAAQIMIVGEGPGQQEDETGEPFCGPSGNLLNALLARAGVRREDVFVTNVVHCRPPGNRDPEPDEIRQCIPFLHAQIEALRPKVIVTLGKYACRHVARQFGQMSALMDLPLEDFRYEHDGYECPVVPLYHPAYLLRQMQGGKNDAATQVLKDTVTRLKYAAEAGA